VRDSDRSLAVDAVLEGCRIARAVAAELVIADAVSKRDRSPVTVADYAVQAMIASVLRERCPEDALVAEEEAGEIVGADALRARVVRVVRGRLPALDDGALLALLAHGRSNGGDRFWTLDPIDGTKGFLRGEQYAVALALVERGEVVLGVLGCPNLLLDLAVPAGARGCVVVAERGAGARMRSLDSGDERAIAVSQIEEASAVTFCESVESEHSSHSDAARIAERLGTRASPLRMDSQCKYAAVARGDVCAYLRLPTRADYREKIWDHAAGALIVCEAGGAVTDLNGRALDFSLGRTLAGNRGVVASNGRVHAAVLAAARDVTANAP
jgi:3'(2'), 5'-bisphosphate nucleotidase